MRLNNNLLKLHITIFIWGFTAILGALISLPALHLVWFRMLIAALSMLGYMLFLKKQLTIGKLPIAKLMGIGCIVCLHWLTFFHSIKISTVAVALVSLSATALFTSLLEPLFKRSSFFIPDLIAAICIIFGIYLIFHFESRYTLGIVVGLTSALMAAIFTIINSRQIQNRSAEVISFYEMSGGFIALSLFLFFSGEFKDFNFMISFSDFGYLFLLGTVCTAMAYVMGVAVMKELSAYTVVLTTNLEPVYGILLAYFIFGDKERMTPGFYAGATLILATVMIYPIIKRKFYKEI